jgi:hypothetical protein
VRARDERGVSEQHDAAVHEPRRFQVVYRLEERLRRALDHFGDLRRESTAGDSESPRSLPDG